MISCKDCTHYWMCSERSRMYPCMEFEHKEKKKEEINDYEKKRPEGSWVCVFRQ